MLISFWQGNDKVIIGLNNRGKSFIVMNDHDWNRYAREQIYITNDKWNINDPFIN